MRAGVHAEADQLAAGDLADRDVPAATVHPDGDLGLHEPADAREERTDDRPLLAVHVVDEDDDRGRG